MIRNIRKDNQGFTLIELLVSIAIVAIVAVSIAAFMIVGSRTYASTSSEVNLQYEAQLAFNQLQDLIIDTSLGVNYSYIAAGDGIDGTEIEVLRDSEIPSDAAFKKIYMYNDTVVYIVIWDREHSWLYYEEYAMNADRTIGAETVDEARMADYITAFGVDLSRLEEKRIVRVDMGFAKNTKTYDSTHNITIRNKVAVNGDPASYTPVTPSGIADSIVVNSPVYLEPGDTYTFPAPVVNSKTTVPVSQEVRWYIDDTAGGAANPHHADTMIDVNAGRLQISPYEDHESFKVTVRARDGSGVSNTITVNVVRVNTVTLAYASTSTPPVTQDKLTNDNTFSLTATVDGYHLNDAGVTTTTAGKSIEDIKKLTWAITDGASYFTGAESSNLVYQCRMNAAAIVKGQTLTVRATNVRSKTYGSGGDKVVYGEWSGKTFQKDPDFVIVGSGSYARGAQHAFNIQKRLGDDWSTHIYLYDVTLKEKVLDAEGNVTGYTNIQEHWNAGIAMSPGETNIQITLPVDLDPYKGYVVDIICYAFVKHRTGDPSGYYLPYLGYDSKDAVGVSNSISLDIGTSELYFSKSGENLVLKKYYIPRTYGQNPNSTSETMIYCSGITNMSGNLQFSGSEFSTGDGNKYKGWVTWKLYTDNMGTTLFNPPTTSGSIFSNEDKNQQFKIYFKKGQWYEEIPARLYLIPTLTIENVTKGQTSSYLMNHTHIEYINHNITVTKDDKNYHLYFPYPTADDFPGKDLAKDESLEGTWSHSFDFSSTMNYTIKRYQESNDVTQYTLKLQNGDTVYGNYTIPVDGMNWVKN